MRLTIRTNLAMRTLMYCAVNPGLTVRKTDIAASCNASENHLGHVINMLGHAGFIETTRGRHGGIRLAREPKDISIGEVCRYFESDLPFTECFTGGENLCPLVGSCELKGLLCRALAAFYATLDAVSLADLTQGNTALTQLLSVEAA